MKSKTKFDTSSVLLNDVIEAVAEYFSLELGQKVKRGIKKAKERKRLQNEKV